MKEYILEVKKIIPSKFCEKIINYFDKDYYNAHTTGHGVDKNIRNCVTRNVLETELELQGLKAYKLFPRIPESSQLTRVVRQYYQEQLAGVIMPYINSSAYKNIKPELKAEKLQQFIRDNLESPLNQVQDTLVHELGNLKRGTVEYEETERKLGESLQIKFKKGKEAYRVEAIQLFKKRNRGNSPDFNNVRDVMKLIVYLKAIEQQRIFR